jgi:hypothetical protein
MIINLNKLMDVKKMTVDLTDGRPFLYFLFQIDETTPRYNRVNGQYVEDKNGSFVMDHGPDFIKQGPRTLVYIGQTKSFIARLFEHYWTGTRGKSKSKTYAVKKFNYIRQSKSFKMFEFDTIRQHYEKILVRKYLPFYNQASRFTKNQIKLILNSNNRIKPQELMKPYVLNSRDIYGAFKAWEIEDAYYLKNDLERPTSKMFEMTKLHHPTKNLKQELTYYNNKGEKYKFGRFIEEIILPFHKKQRKAYLEFKRQMKFFIKMFDKIRHADNVVQHRLRTSNHYQKNKEFLKDRERKYKRLKRRINQPELL